MYFIVTHFVMIVLVSTDRMIRHRACALKDTAYAIIKTELDKEFERTCMDIEESRKRRGELFIVSIPPFLKRQQAFL